MASSTDTRWLFTQEQITNSPSRRDLIDADHELQQRQFTALFINDLGCKLKVTQLCINTAIIYMHRFFMIHSLRKFHPNLVAASCLFFSCKVEEHPRPLKQFIDAIQQLLHGDRAPPIKPDSEEFRARADEIIAYESCLIQTLGFNVLIHHAHPIIIKTCQMIKAPRELAQTAYFMATNSLILTNFCIKYSSDKIACFCIYLACKWTGLKIPPSNEGHEWYQYVNQNINVQLLEDISEEYLNIYNKCPAKIKKKLGFEGKNPDDEKKAHASGGDAQQAATAAVSSSARPHIPLKPSNSSTNVNSQQQQQQSLSASSSSTQIKQEPTTIKQEPHETTAKSYREHLESRTKQQQQPPPQSQQQRPFSQPSNHQQQQQKYVQHPHQKQHPMQPSNQPQNRNPSQKPINSHNIDSNQTSSAASSSSTSSHTGASSINYSQYNIDKRQFAGHYHAATTMSTAGIKRASEDQNLSNSTSNNNNTSNNVSVQPTPNKMAKYITPTEKSVS